MRSNRRKWVCGVGVMLLVVVPLLLASYGTGITPSSAAPPPSNPGTQFSAILDKLDEILAAIGNLSAGAPPPCGAGTGGQRFVVSPDGMEVCDNTTGLNWQKNPDSTERTHVDALAHCPTVRPASRLPEVKELISLLDYTNVPALPASHPFTNVGGNSYWSATTDATHPTTQAWFVADVGVVGNIPKDQALHVWCVRGA